MNNVKVEMVDIIMPVTVRKYSIDTKRLQEVLRSHKCLSNQVIADKLNVPKTKVEHWFRTDNCFAIPDANSWFKLKELLNIETDEFDKAIITFITKDNVYDKSNRCYKDTGIAPALTCGCGDEKIIITRPYSKHKYVVNKYIKFILKYNYVPKLFCPYHCYEILDICPALTTYCGSTTNSSTVLVRCDK